jgi:hypothetical protein
VYRLYDEAHGRLRGNGWSGAMWFTLLLIGIISLLSVGCPATAPYQPNDKIVNELGVERAKQRLREIVIRSVSPQVVNVEVTDDYFAYNFRQAIAGFQTGAIINNRVYFLNAVLVNVYDNNLVNVLTSNQQVVAQLTFGNPDDARMFGDLVTSFRLRKASMTR